MLKNNVLRKKEDFQDIYDHGKSVGGSYVVLFYRKNNLDFNRTAFLASKKVGNSVERNRARRLMKESFRHLTDRLPIGFDFVIIARNTISDKKCIDVEKSLTSCLVKAGVISKK